MVASRGLAGLAALAAKAAAQGRSPIQQATQAAQRQQTSRDPAAPRFAPPAAAPGFSDQQYASPERRYSEQELAQSVNQLFSQSRNASRAAAQDQVYVEGSRAQNQRTLQSDAIYGQQELQRAGLENQRRLAEMSINASLQMQRSQPQYAPVRQTTSVSAQFRDPALMPGGGGSRGSSSSGSDPAAAAKAAMDAQLASRERMQSAQIAAGDRQQAAQLQFQREAPGLQANAEDELRRRAAMRALEVFRQGQGGGQQALSLSNQGRVA
jgi:hypothetical protein